jgi:L-ascorbate metabolism protein UlaG (beta-lactamase superfamily)
MLHKWLRWVLARAMKLTKLEHSALLLESTGQKLFIDPGSFTTPLTDTANAVAVVITHEHADHWTPEQLDRIIAMSPDVQIFGPAGVASAASGQNITIVSAGDTVEAGPFTLRFFGQKHAVIHESIPVIDNIGVLVNDELYYAGDSFTIPEGVAVGTLAVPAGAPWLKIGEVIDYVLAVKAKRTFPTHEMVLSRSGKDLSNARIKSATEQAGGEFFPLEPNESLDL